MADLPASLQRSLTATATLAVAELFSEGKSAGIDTEEWPLARISERLDGRACPLCAAVHEKIVAVGSEAYRKWRAPSHINCRRVMEYVHRDEAGAKVTFEEPDPELVRKHGHYHLRPERHAALRVPAEPAGRHFIVRRVKHAETGEVRTVLDWAPWWEQVPQGKRRLVLRARVASEAELPGLLERLGITDPTDPEQGRQLTLLGLRDRVEGWLTTRYSAGGDMALIGDMGRLWRQMVRSVRGEGPVPIQRSKEVFEKLDEAEAWAKRNLTGVQNVNYSEADPRVATAINQVLNEVTSTFPVQIAEIGPFPGGEDGPWMRVPEPDKLLYNPTHLGPGMGEIADAVLGSLPHSAPATKSLRGLVAHETAHLIQVSARSSLGGRHSPEYSEKLVQEIVDAFRKRRGESAIREELGDRAWEGNPESPAEAWKETWAEAFSAYWIDRTQISRPTQRMVEQVLKRLFPEPE